MFLLDSGVSVRLRDTGQERGQTRGRRGVHLVLSARRKTGEETPAHWTRLLSPGCKPISLAGEWW